MIETKISIDRAKPVDFYGVNNTKLQLIKNFFPTMTISVRENEIIAKAYTKDIKLFTNKISKFIEHFNKFNILTEFNIEKIILEGNPDIKNPDDAKDIILFAHYDKIIKTQNQTILVKQYSKNDLLFTIASTDTDRTNTAIALAVRALQNKKEKRTNTNTLYN